MNSTPPGGGPGVAVLVAYYAPPAAGIAAQRMAGIIRHLPDFGWEPVVVAPRHVHHHQDPASLEVLEQVRVIRTPNPEPSRWLRRAAGGAGDVVDATEPGVLELRPVAAGGWRGMARRLVRSFLYVPDAQALWIPWAARAAAELVLEAKGRRRVVLFSSSVPFSAHFAARSAARRTGVPWVAEYRDPWSTASGRGEGTVGLRGQVDRGLDATVVSALDHLVVTSERTRELFLGTFPEVGAGNVTVVRNGWDPPVGRDIHGPPPPGAPLTLAYAGSLLKPEWAAALLDGVEGLLVRYPGAVIVDVFGPRQPWERLLERRSAPVPYLVLHGMIPGSQIASRLRQASAVVVLQPDAFDYVPGKVYDYLGARRPVVADVPRGSEAEGLLAGFGDLRSVWRRGSDGVAEELSRLLAEHRSGELAGPSVAADVVAGLSRRAQVGVLAGVFQRLAAP